MIRVQLTIRGVPDFRAELALQSQKRWDEAVAQIGHAPKDPCSWTLVDKLKERPERRFYWDRAARGYVTPEQAFGEDLINERQTAGFDTKSLDGGEPRFFAFFRHQIHFAAFTLYKPATQSELDERAERRETKRAEKASEAERAAAPLFFSGRGVGAVSPHISGATV